MERQSAWYLYLFMFSSSWRNTNFIGLSYMQSRENLSPNWGFFLLCVSQKHKINVMVGTVKSHKKEGSAVNTELLVDCAYKTATHLTCNQSQSFLCEPGSLCKKQEN